MEDIRAGGNCDICRGIRHGWQSDARNVQYNKINVIHVRLQWFFLGVAARD